MFKLYLTTPNFPKCTFSGSVGICVSYYFNLPLALEQGELILNWLLKFWEKLHNLKVKIF